MRISRVFFYCALLAVMASCNNHFVNAKVSKDVEYFKHEYDASANQCYYALRWALKMNGYPIVKENLRDGIIETAWVPANADSHYMPYFGRKDSGVSGTYHQLEVKVVPIGGKTTLEVASRIKSVVSTMKSSGFEERKILAEVGDYLRAGEPVITNEGIEE